MQPVVRVSLDFDFLIAAVAGVGLVEYAQVQAAVLAEVLADRWEKG